MWGGPERKSLTRIYAGQCSMTKGTAVAKRRNNYEKMMTIFPERSEFYLAEIEKLNAQLVTLQVCRLCGRPLKSDDAREIGYGKDCLARMEALEAT